MTKPQPEVMEIDRTEPGTSQMGEILLLGVEEIIGQPGLNAVLNLSGQLRVGSFAEEMPALRIGFNNLAALANGLEKLYGPRGGRGVAIRAGRASFKYLLRQYGAALEMIDVNFRMLPVPVRLKTGMQALASLMGRLGDEQVTIGETNTHWTWTAEHCPYCWQHSAEEPTCQFPVGLLQEFLAWATSGRVYGVREVECMSTGNPACVIQVNKKPFD